MLLSCHYYPKIPCIIPIRHEEFAMRHLLLPLELKSMDDDRDKSIHADDIIEDAVFRVEGNAAVFGNVDSFNDIIEKGAFTNTLQGSLPPILWQHDRDQPIGVAVMLIETDHGLFLRAELPKDDTFVTGRVMPQLRVGGVKSLSIGFTVEKSRQEGDNRVIEGIDLKEISIVTLPANDQALISSFKNASPFADLPLAPLDREWAEEEARGRVRTATNSVEEPSSDYKKAFFFYDDEKEDDFTGYKFPFVDVIDGELVAVARAINNASARLDSSNIPQDDKTAIRKNIDRYREKIERIQEEENADKSAGDNMSDDKALHDFERIQTMSHAELKNALMGGISFSREAANFIASASVSESKEKTEERELVKALQSATCDIKAILPQHRN